MIQKRRATKKTFNIWGIWQGDCENKITEDAVCIGSILILSVLLRNRVWFFFGLSLCFSNILMYNHQNIKYYCDKAL